MPSVWELTQIVAAGGVEATNQIQTNVTQAIQTAVQGVKDAINTQVSGKGQA